MSKILRIPNCSPYSVVIEVSALLQFLITKELLKIYGTQVATWWLNWQLIYPISIAHLAKQTLNVVGLCREGTEQLTSSLRYLVL